MDQVCDGLLRGADAPHDGNRRCLARPRCRPRPAAAYRFAL